jgi:hypothetical protein
MTIKRKIPNTNQLNKIVLFLNQDNIFKTKTETAKGACISTDVIDQALKFLIKFDIIYECREFLTKKYQLVKIYRVEKIETENHIHASEGLGREGQILNESSTLPSQTKVEGGKN